jgi:iron complex outermembrane receptor protein
MLRAGAGLITILALVTGLVRAPGAAGGGTEFDDFSEVRLEDLLEQVVVTASRYEQKQSESPLPTTVITAEEIRASGATSIPELLRMVPGMDVMVTSAGDANVTARGFNGLLANKMLVMIDGRSVYMDFYSVIPWEALPVVLDDIQSIEVIRGPGSALYGANAFLGVIQIITKPVDEAAGTLVSGGGGERGTYFGSAIHAGRRGSFGYKVTAGVHGFDHWDAEGKAASQQASGTATLERSWGADAAITAQAGVSSGEFELYPDPITGALESKGPMSFLRADYRHGQLRARAFWNHADFDLTPQDDFTILSPSHLLVDTYDAELQHSFHPLQGHRVTWGGSVRHNRLDWQMLGELRSQDLFAGFIHDEYRASDRVILYLGGRYDHHPLVEDNVSPRGGIVIVPARNHTLRASVGTAFRNPSLMQSYWSTSYEVMPGASLSIHGDENLEPERITSVEVGYGAPLGSRAIASIDLFHNEIENLIDPSDVAYFPSPPAPMPGIPVEIAFRNTMDAEAWGGETECSFRLANWLRGTVNYAYLQVEDTRSERRIESWPEHRINARLQLNPTGKVFLHLEAHWLSEAKWTWSTLGAAQTATIDSRTLVSGKLAYRTLDGHLELSLAAFNLFDEPQREHPSGEELRRRIIGSMSVQF